jgi:hypothetical protein
MGAVSFRTTKPKSPHDVWREFFSNAALLKKHRVTEDELQILREFSPLGVVICTGDILFILETIRWANRKHRT